LVPLHHQVSCQLLLLLFSLVLTLLQALPPLRQQVQQ
jgi:hypothetical protein